MSNVTLTEYWDMLNRHDWTYEYSDDGSVYRRGHAAQQALENVSDTSPAHKSLFLAFRDYSYYPSRGPKPERPSE